MVKRILIFACCALFLLGSAVLLLGCVEKRAEAQSAPTPAVYAIGAGEHDDAALPAPTPPTTPIPVGKVEYRPDPGAHYKILKDNTVSVTDGYVEILVNGMAFSSDIETADGGSVKLILTNGATLTGALIGETMLDFSVSMDEKSAWMLSDDTRVDALVNSDHSFANVISNGHSLSYNCENGENAYLDRAAITLAGGGQLIPVI